MLKKLIMQLEIGNVYFDLFAFKKGVHFIVLARKGENRL